jgi:hypothetical protein
MSWRFFGRLVLVISLVFFWESAGAEGHSAVQRKPLRPIRLALRYFLRSDTVEVASATVDSRRVALLFEEIDRIWVRCAISFEPSLERPQEFEGVPGDLWRPRTLEDLFSLRRTLGRWRALLVAVVGDWTRGADSRLREADAWTAMPGSVGHGVVVRWGEHLNSRLLAHELGHYLGLRHRENGEEDEGGPRALMAPRVYRRSIDITPTECRLARKVAVDRWSFALRPGEAP